MRRVIPKVIALLFASFVPIAPFAAVASGQTSCDARKEMMDVLLALDRYASYATDALTLRRIAIGDAVKAGVEFAVLKTRAYYACRAQLTAEGSKERRLMELATRSAGGFDLLLVGTSDDAPLVKGGQAAHLELIGLAHNYFSGSPIKAK